MLRETIQVFSEANRKTAIIAALPLLLFGLLIAGIAAFLSAIGRPSQIVNIGEAVHWHYTALIVSAISLLLLLFAAVASIKTTLPIWSYTWSVTVLSGFIVSMNLVLDDRIVAISRWVDLTVVGLAILSCLVFAFRVATQGWQHTGLLSIGFCGTLGLALCFFSVAGSSLLCWGRWRPYLFTCIFRNPILFGLPQSPASAASTSPSHGSSRQYSDPLTHPEK
jgi:hypothetical protein